MPNVLQFRAGDGTTLAVRVGEVEVANPGVAGAFLQAFVGGRKG